LRFAVTDSGIGIAEDQQADLFQSFSQADASTTRKYGGTGLGLAISKQLVEMMGGEIGVESSSGEGSRFSFSVSFAIAKEPFGHVGSPQCEADMLQMDSLSALYGAYLLVAEDNEINQEVAEGLLARVGINIRVVKNGRQAVAALREETFDGVLMDMQMPVMDGLDATREIRKDDHFGGIAIIAMTANAMQGDRERCLKAGMNDYIAKPINPDVLYSTLLKWVKFSARPQLADIVPTEESIRHEDMQTVPELDGLDVEEALIRMGGDSNLYRRILVRFHESQGDVIAKLRRSLADADRETVQYIAHTLKGAAGNVGAAQIRDMAAELEHTMASGGDIREAFLDQLEAALVVLVNDLGRWLALSRDRRKQKSASGQADALPLIGKMRKMLEDYDGNAVDLMDDLKDALKNSSVSKDINRLQLMLDSYDFEAALEMLKRLQNKVG
jgi:CheY-like chemotaxis protein